MPLPPGPTAPPLAPTARWLFSPIAFMEAARRRHGDNFSVRFVGFQSPMVMLSDPEVIRALYTEREHGLPPGRTVALRPVMGARSLLLLEGAEHLARRRMMLPPFHGERMQAYEDVMRSVAEEEIARWPSGTPFALHPHMQAVTLEVILSAVFGVTDPERRARLRELLPQLLSDTASVGLQVRVLLSRRNGGDPFAELRRLLDRIDALLLDEIAERRADEISAAGGPPSESDLPHGCGRGTLPKREDILALPVAARF